MAPPTDALGTSVLVARTLRTCSLALAAVALLSSCGGGGGDGGGGAGGASTPTTYLFFTGGASAALGAVDPGNATPAGLITVEPNIVAITNNNVAAVYAGSYDAAALRITGVHHHAVTYFKDVGGAQQLFKASALMGAAPVPVRVSSASFANSSATTLCSVVAYPDYANSDNSRIVYTQAGVDAACGGTDNRLSMATLSMSSTTAPVLHATPGASVVRELRSNSGAITGWIMLLGTNLMWYQADMASGTSQLLAASVTSVSYLASGAGREFLAINSQVRIFDGTVTLKNPGSAATALTASFDCRADQTYLFCADTTPVTGCTIRRLPLDGSATWTAIYTGFSETMTGIVLSESRVLFRDTSTMGQLNVSSVPKVPFNPAFVSPALVCRFSTTNSGDERIIASGPRVYCSETSDSPARVKHIREDGEDEVLITDAAGTTLYWTWQGGSTRAVNEWQKAERLILGGQTGSGVNRLTSYDGSSGLVLADLTSTLWTGFTFAAPLGDANKGNTLIILSDSGTGDGELFFANNATANSLVRLTTTANSEAFVGASGCAIGSGQVPDPLLAMLVVVAALYIWRRREKRVR